MRAALVYLGLMYSSTPLGTAMCVATIISFAMQPAIGQQPRLAVEPRQPAAGSLVRLTIDLDTRHADSVVAIAGTMAGEPLHFRPASDGKLEALGAIPVDASDSIVATAELARLSGGRDTLRLVLPYPHQPPPLSQSRGRRRGASRLRNTSTRRNRSLRWA